MEEPIIFVICYTIPRNDSDLNVKRISMFVANSRRYKWRDSHDENERNNQPIGCELFCPVVS